MQLANFEFKYQAIDGDGRLLDESTPRAQPLSWAPGLAMALIRRRHPEARLVRLRRAGAGQPWQEWEQ